MRPLIATIAVALLAPAAALADNGPELPPPATWTSLARNVRVQRDLAIAATYWHAAPDCPGGYHVWRAPLADGIGGQADMPGCRMWLAPIVLERDGLRWMDAYLCVVIAHEYGHSLGHPHSLNPNDVMYDGDVSTKVVPACAAQEHRPGWRPAPHARRGRVQH